MNIDNRQFLSINQLADTYLQGTQKVQSASENNNVSFEKILEDNNRVVGCSVKVLYALRKNRFIETLKKFENKPKCSRTLIIVPQDFCDLINKYDVRKIGNIIFIDKHILETRFDQNYPCILAEKNIMELVKKGEKYTLYSDTKTYYDFFNLGE